MPSVLVVDDSPVDRRLAGRLLEKMGDDVEVYYAEDGRKALEQVESHLPDLVVTDMQMPELDGFGLVAELKRFPLIPVILMTAAGSEEIAVRALQAGASSYVPKRQLADELADVAERVLAMSRTQRSQARVLNRMRRWETEFEVENDRDLVLSLSSHLQQNLAAMNVCDQSAVLRVGIALEEALLNAFYHGNLEVSSKLREQGNNAYTELARQRSQQEPYKDRRIFVTAQLSRDSAEFVVRDQGPGFDPSHLPDPTDPEYLERPHGRGLMLMRTFMDDVTYNPTGNEVRMRKAGTPAETQA